MKIVSKNNIVSIAELEKSIVVIDLKMENITFYSDKDLFISLNLYDIKKIAEELEKGQKNFQANSYLLNVLVSENILSIGNVLLKIDEFKELVNYIRGEFMEFNKKSKTIYERLIFNSDAEVKNEEN